MCCRYYYDPLKVNRALEDLGVIPSAGADVPGGVITPGSASLMLTGGSERMKSASAVWGFPGKESGTVINARSETVPLRPMFRGAFAERRCLLPAECFYEWDAEKNKVTFSQPDEPVIYLAGIWSLYDGLARFVVLTTAANESMRPVHDRMPLMIGRESMEPWLYDTAFALRQLNAEMPVLAAKREYEQMSLFD